MWLCSALRSPEPTWHAGDEDASPSGSRSSRLAPRGRIVLDDHDVRSALPGDGLRHGAEVDVLLEVAQLHRAHHSDVSSVELLQQVVLQRVAWLLGHLQWAVMVHEGDIRRHTGW